MADDNSTPSIQAEKPKRVKNANGTRPGTDGDQIKYKFSSSPTGLFEHKPRVGEVRVMTVTVECTASGDEQIRDGVRHVANWAVRNAQLGRQTTLPDDDQQTAIDDDEIAKESEQAELALVGEAEKEQADAEQKAVSGVDDPFNPTAKA
ncbi:hypothetical protein SEA_VERITY_52 [Gordonia phage Verity]|uniref:Uncharacterized protein n=2 Tax=Zitchvirus TaxID=2948963 RepID=A0A514DIV2_9CAUD|nr:hypothetical protein J1775_gp53 [Gordonia phage Zipp]YP_010002890.1 hypothetical protein J1776_gp52 [Gordonia phage Verity]QPO16895.1 hypothetical protein SEA_DELREY21_52 [Gordonia phage Delrey21]QXN74178.1 hypothetical protein SEA_DOCTORFROGGO_52 [Gordonia phage DoctorFroggo]QDH93207.1 hypothetical protein SEA_ZIPP_53 [Gordonia phage Zipp]QDH93538.1 hypothetical protein SEA_VERITY_52 [Gordonia phage Verity]